MKKLCIITIFTSLCFLSNAQVQKGKLFFGGTSHLNASFSNNRAEYDGDEMGKSKSSSFNINPELGYLFTDNFMFGLNMSTSISNSDDFKFTSIGFGPATRIYFGKNTNIRPFLHGQLGYVYMKDVWQLDFFEGQQTETTKSTGIYYIIGFGTSFFFNEHVSFDAMLEYNANSTTDSDDEKSKNYSNTTTIGIGFSFYL